MHDAGVAFGERVVGLGYAPSRLPGPLLLPIGQIRPGPGAPSVASSPSWGGGVWLPGPGDTVRGRAEHAARPGAEQRAAAAVDALGLQPTVQDPVDVDAAQRLAPSGTDELRHAAATLDLGAWRYKIRHCPPGPRLAALLSERPESVRPAPGRGAVIAGEPGTLSGAVPDDDQAWPQAVLDSITARHRLISHLQAQQYTDIAQLSGCYPGIHQFLSTELALALHTTDAEGAALLGAAEALRDRLPDTRQALDAGHIDGAKAMAIIRATTSTTAEIAAQVERQVLPHADSVTATTLRRRAARAVIAADPDGASARHRRARTERHAWRAPDQDGMGRLGVYAPAPDIATIWHAITAVADAIRRPGDTRTLGERRADALTMICTDILSAGGWTGLKLPGKSLSRPRIVVTVPYTVLLGHRAPCYLHGHGPITTEQALALVGDGDLYRMICDPVTGQLLDYGHTRYRPPPHLAEFVRARDSECPMPSCHHPADRGHLDHIIPAKPDPATGKPTHGTTSAENLAPPCPHHHLGKDAGRGFTLHRAADGTYTWTTPLGRAYTWRPEPHWHPGAGSLPGTADGGGDQPPGTCTCLSRTGPADDAPAGPCNHRTGNPDTDDGDPPVCECPDTCPCQHGPTPGRYDTPPPLTVDDDWADGYAADPTDSTVSRSSSTDRAANHDDTEPERTSDHGANGGGCVTAGTDGGSTADGSDPPPF